MSLCRLRHIAFALSCSSVLAFAAPAPGLTIDDFEFGDFTVTDPVTFGPPTNFEQPGLPTSSVINGVRGVRVQVSGTTTLPIGSEATASLTTTPADDGSTHSVTSGNPNASGTFDYNYDGIANGAPNNFGGALNLDLNPFTAINVEVLGASLLGTVHLTLWNATVMEPSAAVPLLAGTIPFALSDFSLNLSNIKQIRVTLSGIGILDPAPSITHIAAVPEPGTALLLAAGLLVVAARRRVPASAA